LVFGLHVHSVTLIGDLWPCSLGEIDLVRLMACATCCNILIHLFRIVLLALSRLLHSPRLSDSHIRGLNSERVGVDHIFLLKKLIYKKAKLNFAKT
tara:strand:- start:33 stop:320 length:288 start_codon:yes stop_codon:yes gene_type:complete